MTARSFRILSLGFVVVALAFSVALADPTTVSIAGFAECNTAEREALYGWLGCSGLGWPVYQALTSQTWQNDLAPQLAESWELDASGTTWTFHLRKDVKWHDGEAFTAEDVDWSYHMALHSDVPVSMGNVLEPLVGASAYIAGDASRIEGLVLVDDYTIQLVTEDVIPLLDWGLRNIPIAPKHRFLGVSPDMIVESEIWNEPIGTGPFRFVKTVPGEYALLEAFQDYYLGAPKIDQMVAYYMRDPEAILSGLKTGQLDAVTLGAGGRKFTNEDLEDLRDLGYKVELRSAPGFSRLVFASDAVARTPLSLNVRRAIAMAIDADAIVESLIAGAISAEKLVPMGKWHYTEPEPYGYNPEEARRLLEEEGWDPSTTLELATYFAGEGSRAELEAIQSYLADVGINVNISQVDGPTIIEQFYVSEPRKVDIVYGGGGTSPEPTKVGADNFGWNWYPNGWNGGQWAIAPIDALGREVQKVQTDEDMYDLVTAINVLLHQYLPEYPLWHLQLAVVISDRLQVGEFGHGYVQPAGKYLGCESWWIQED